MASTGFNIGFCNIFGAETGGAEKVLGGLSDSPPDRQWYCKERAIGRYRMECAHGHRGQVMTICQIHVRQFSGKVTFCPRCNTTELIAHNCRLVLKEVS